MGYEEEQKRLEEAARKREKKRHPAMKVSGRGMKRFAQPKKTKH